MGIEKFPWTVNRLCSSSDRCQVTFLAHYQMTLGAWVIFRAKVRISLIINTKHRCWWGRGCSRSTVNTERHRWGGRYCSRQTHNAADDEAKAAAAEWYITHQCPNQTQCLMNGSSGGIFWRSQFLLKVRKLTTVAKSKAMVTTSLIRNNEVLYLNEKKHTQGYNLWISLA